MIYFFLITQELQHIRLVALLCLVVGVSLSACGGGSGSSPGTGASKPAPASTAEGKAPVRGQSTRPDGGGADKTLAVQANAICETAKGEQSAGFVAMGKRREQNPIEGQSEKAGLEEVVLKVALPPITSAAQKLSELEAPAKQLSKIDALAKGLERAAGEAEANPLSISANSEQDPFEKANDLAASLGFDACAHLG